MRLSCELFYPTLRNPPASELRCFQQTYYRSLADGSRAILLKRTFSVRAYANADAWISSAIFNHRFFSCRSQRSFPRTGSEPREPPCSACIRTLMMRSRLCSVLRLNLLEPCARENPRLVPSASLGDAHCANGRRSRRGCGTFQPAPCRYLFVRLLRSLRFFTRRLMHLSERPAFFKDRCFTRAEQGFGALPLLPLKTPL